MNLRCSTNEAQTISSRSPKRVEQRIVRNVGKAIADFNLISHGDHILVAVSGGKDSFTLLDMLEKLRKKAPISFSILAVNIHHGFPAYRSDWIEAYLREQGFETYMHRANIAGVLEKKLNPTEQRCSLCSRLRRGVLYRLAPQLGCNKIALGHHKDDLIETLLLNLLFTGQLKSMPPLLRSEDGRNLVIRPLAYVDEADIIAYAQMKRFPLVCCSCPSCGKQDNQQRRAIKDQLSKMEEKYPGLRSSILTSMKNVISSHLLDPNLLGGRSEDRSESI